jgi:hypothetical protein
MKFLLIIAVFAGLVISGSVQSGEIKINQRFTGVGNPTAIDTNEDGAFASSSFFQVVGSPGRSTIQSFVEFGPPLEGDTPGCNLEAGLEHQSFVQTFNDGSMLFFATSEGLLCLSYVPFKIWVDLAGVLTGGTGRFEGASGSWTIESEAFPVGVFQNAFTGTMRGTIEIPD